MKVFLMVYSPFLRFSLSLFGSRWLVFGIFGAVLIATILFFGGAMLLRRIRQRRASKKSARDALPVSAAPIAPDETNPLPSLITLVSPLSGKMIEPDESDTGEQSVCRCIIAPSEGKVYAPFDCRIASLGGNARSLALEGADSVRLTIEIGRDDPETAERDFIPCCKAGDKVKEGELLLSFDMEALEKADYDLTSAVWVVNADDFAEVKLTQEKKVSVGDHLMTLVPKNMTNNPSRQA